jgi:hypothetical protein
MSDKHNYFPTHSSIEDINASLYTDYSFMDKMEPMHLEVKETEQEKKDIKEARATQQPPF